MRANAAVVLLSLSHYLPTQLCVYHLEFSVSVCVCVCVSVLVCFHVFVCDLLLRGRCYEGEEREGEKGILTRHNPS